MPEPIRTAGLLVNTQRRAPAEAAARLVPWLRERGVTPVFDEEMAAWMRGETGTPESEVLGSDIVVVLGGDGTVLRAARHIGGRGTPMLPIRYGAFGFLAEAEPEETTEALERVFSGDYEVEERPMLHAVRSSEGADDIEGSALNDVALFRGSSPRLVKLEAFVDGEPLATYSGDGVVTATATGSTAYSLAAGGPIVHPTLDTILLTPISPHALHFRPLLLPGKAVVTMRIAEVGGEAQVTVDGQTSFPLVFGERLTVQLSGDRARFITLPGGMTFYGRVRDRLRWGERLL